MAWPLAGMIVFLPLGCLLIHYYDCLTSGIGRTCPFGGGVSFVSIAMGLGFLPVYHHGYESKCQHKNSHSGTILWGRRVQSSSCLIPGGDSSGKWSFGGVNAAGELHGSFGRKERGPQDDRLCSEPQLVPFWEKGPFSPFRQNLVKPPQRLFLDYVVDSLGEINLLFWRICPMPYDIMVL